MKRRDLLAAAALLGPGLGRAQTPMTPASPPVLPRFSDEDLRHAARLRAAGLADTQAWTLLQQLCNDIGPRPAGSAADARAVAWAQTALRGLGLKNVRAEPVPLRVWQRGPASATLLVPQAAGAVRSEPLVMAALGNSVATPAEGIEAEIAWYADFAALKADSADPATSRARGRIVIVDQKMERARDGSGYGPAVAARSLGAIEAARRGALAVGIRSIGTDRAPIAHTGAMRYDLGVPRIPAFAMSVPDAERLAALQAGLAPDARPLRLKLLLQSRSDVDALTHNVIAEVPGSDLADEIVLMGGHLDSWDLGRGAQDDGAGCLITAAAAAVIQAAGQRPRRTVRVVLFGNEENGLDGAAAYAERYKAVTHQMVSESDFGAGRIYQIDSRVQPAALPLFGEMAEVLAPLGVTWRDSGRNTGSPGPDSAYLMRRNRWPGVALSQDGTNYFDIHHTEHDTLDRIDPASLSQNVACWAVTAWLAAQAPVVFGPPVL
jgi:hypothetical protein